MALPRSASGVCPAARAIRKNSQAAIADATASSPASAAPPANSIASAIGAAMTPNRIRRVSSDMDPSVALPRQGVRNHSHFHDFGFLRLDQLIDLVNEVVVQLLEVLLRVLHVVLRRSPQLLEHVASVRARVADGDLPFLRELVHDLHELLAALLVHR